MQLSDKGVKFLIKEEGVKLSSYLDVANVWTIGTGFTYYEDGTPVKEGDKITAKRNESLFKRIVLNFENNLNKKLKTSVNQNQYDALISLSFNIGISGFNNSSALKAINVNPNDPQIKKLIELWRFATVKGEKKPVLLARRKRETDLYFTKWSI